MAPTIPREAARQTAPPLKKPLTRRTEPIFDLRFTERWRHRPFSVVADGFVEDAWEPTEQGLVSRRGPVAPFAGVEVELDGRVDGEVYAGLASGSVGMPDLLAVYEPARHRVRIVARDGDRTTVLARASLGRWRRSAAGSDVSALGFVLCENQVTVLLRGADRKQPRERWSAVLTERAKVATRVDLRDPRVLSRYRYAAGARETGDAVGLRARAGLFGMAGLRDPHLVQHSDGRPYVVDGAMFVTFTCAGLGFFAQAHWGVFRFDPECPDRFEQVSQIFFKRDGLVLGDHAGQIVRDEDAGCWEVGVSSWGDFDGAGVHVRRASTTADLLTGVHVLDSEPVAMPTSVSCWDPGMTRIGGRWHVSFVESPSQRPFAFHPALAVGTDSGWHDGLELRGAATRLRRCEGPVLARIQDRWWLLASDGASRTYPVFDLDVQQAGRLEAPYASNIPHPQVVPRDDGSWLLLTFDGTDRSRRVTGYGGHGEVIVMLAERNVARAVRVPSPET